MILIARGLPITLYRYKSNLLSNALSMFCLIVLLRIDCNITFLPGIQDNTHRTPLPHCLPLQHQTWVCVCG